MWCKERDAVVKLRYARLALCNDCFIKYFIKRLTKTVEEFKMFRNTDKIAVAVSGGKDSTALVHSLKYAYPDLDITIIHLNLGIGEYSRHSLEVVKELSKTMDMPLIIYDLKNERGYTIPDLLRTKYKQRICGACSIIKRSYLTKLAYENGFNVLATGHNLDDIVEVMLNLFIEGDFQGLISMKPALEPKHEKQVRKVKPLVKHHGWEIKHYIKVLSIPHVDMICPLSKGARSIWRKDILNRWERKDPTIKRRLFNVFIRKLIPILERNIEPIKLDTCKICGGPSIGDICSKCKIESEVLATIRELR